MAIYKNGKMSGKLGDVIHSSWHGRPYTRRKPETVANPQTESQQAHRNAFAEISRLSSAMKTGHQEGLHWQAVRQKLNTHSVFKKLNKNCYGPNGIDYPRVKISEGSVSRANITYAKIDAEGNISVLFDGMHVGIVEFDECAVFTAKKCLAFEIVTGIQLVGPFALRVCSVGIEGCQGIGVFHGEGWQVVDERRGARHGAPTAERHIVRAFRLCEDAHALL